jgi:creatinine amidohydrolase
MPATLDAVVSDVVDSLYRQDFKIVVLINSHGGNFALRPAVRRINYNNSGRKTVFVDPWEMVPHAEMTKIFEGKNELHCGEIEVSVMMYLFPEVVRTDKLEDGDPDALRMELDLFSIPALSGGKPWGLAGRATAEKGKAFYELMVDSAVKYIRRVIDRHREMPSYHG